MAYWEKIQYLRKVYVINFDRINTFCYENNGRVTFWLPDCAVPIVVNPVSNLEDYRKIFEYTEYLKNAELNDAYWVKISYQKNEYIINLNSINSFYYEENGRLTFWLPDITQPFILHPVSNLDSYKTVVKYLQEKTGYINS
ncbi:hypothetical protein VB711_04885 [Cronbergia sp. UHCC 0137]|uniref:hypothetical protein n=1 Tax=Cronbergia sp. UHCC 0137 TaxID=3110239 RepID=UPI002B2127F5|nr:hypothetical protein [Cronbergia sp. UHCC 0137]MEA5617174.1 hypothetical protein [Cronbergia sp. UHCC 0137]